MTANVFKLQPQLVAAGALGLLYKELVLPTTVYRDAEADFVGKFGMTVNVRRPARLTAADAGVDVSTRNVTASTLTETTFPITIDKYPNIAVDLSDEDLTHNLDDFGARVLFPQVRSIAEFVETATSAVMISGTATGGITALADGTDIMPKITHARRVLNDNAVPMAGRYLAISTDVEELLLNRPELLSVLQSGSDGALRDAVIGRLRGFTVVVSNYLPAATAVAYHPTAFSLVTRAPAVPDGAAFGAAQSYNGLAMRWVRDYDPAKLSDRSVLGTYLGVKAITEEDTVMRRAVRINFTG